MKSPPVEEHFFSQAHDVEQLVAARRTKAGHIVGLLSPFVRDTPVRRALSIGSSFCIIEEEIKRQLIPGAELICTDLDRDALERFDQPALTKLVVSATELEFGPDAFDLILAHQVLEHINAYPDILERFRQLCRPGGLIYINVPNPRSPMIGKLPNGHWPRPVWKELLQHNLKKVQADFMANTEQYHTGFTEGYLRRAMPEFEVHDLRKARLAQVFQKSWQQHVLGLWPRQLLFLAVETNLWCLRKRDGKRSA